MSTWLIGDEMIQNFVHMCAYAWSMVGMAWSESRCFLMSKLYSTGRGPCSRSRGFFSLWMNQDSNNSHKDTSYSESSTSIDDQSIPRRSCHTCSAKAEAFASPLCTAHLCSFSLPQSLHRPIQMLLRLKEYKRATYAQWCSSSLPQGSSPWV